MVERQTRDLEIRVRVPVQVKICFLKFNNGMFLLTVYKEVNKIFNEKILHSDII